MRASVERSFRHLAWANSRMLEILRELPDEAINFSAWNPDWTVGKIVNHIAVAEGRLVARIKNEGYPVETEAPTTAIGIQQLVPIFAVRDMQLLQLVDTPDEIRRFVQFGKDVEFLTSTILAQALHHASEHRAQISDILASNNMDVFNLDSIDFWSFEKWERAQGK
jgi:uncharacterized damage-inducible protein DinB